MGSTPRRCLLLVMLLCATVPASAQEPPGFLIETITIEGVEREAARRIVLAESLLREGRAYSEDELRDAIYRVKRLAFIVDADMALRKGSERGAYELVITVAPAKPLVYEVEAGISASSPNDLPSGVYNVSYGTALTLGGRIFVGSDGLLFGSVQAFDDDLGTGVAQVGYTQYGLLGRGSYATVGVSSALGEGTNSSVTSNLQTSVQAGIPLRGNHALQFDYSWTHLVMRSLDFIPGVEPGETQLDGYMSQLQWIYDSTDDPIFATVGLRATTEVAFIRQRQTFRSDEPSSEETFVDDWVIAGAQGRNYWRLTPRQVVALDVAVSRIQGIAFSGGVGTTSLDGHSDRLSIEAIHAVSLWGEGMSRRVGDFRLEAGAGVEYYSAADEVLGSNDTTVMRFHAALLFRNRWGLVRLSVIYRDRLGEPAFR